MAEGDTVFLAARRIERALGSRELVEVRSPNRRGQALRAERHLTGAKLKRARSYGKNLLLDFDNGLSIYSHLRINGTWDVYPRGSQWRRHPRAAWLVLGTEGAQAVQFGGPVLELKRTAQTALDPRISRLGPDLLSRDFTVEEGVESLRRAGGGRELGEALLDQGVLAGLGNVLKSEACFAAGIDPWRKLGELDGDERTSIVEESRRIIRSSVSRGPRPRRPHNVYSRAGKRCLRCGEMIRSRGQGDDNRITYWCPGCQG